MADGVRSRTSERDQLPISRIGRRLLESGSTYTEYMRRYPRKPHHHASQIRYVLNLSNLLPLINRLPPTPTGQLEHLSYAENRVLRQLTLRAPFPQVPALSLGLTPRTLSTITSPVFSKFVLELGKLPNSLDPLGNSGAAATRLTSSSRIDLFRSAANSGSLSERVNCTTGGTFQTHAKESFPFLALSYSKRSIRLIDTGVRCVGRQRIGT